MATVRILTILLLGVVGFCGTIGANGHKPTTPDTVTVLLKRALLIDTIELNNQFDDDQPFLFFKSGHIFNKREKNAIVVTCPTKETYLVKLYNINGNKIELIDSINDLEANRPQFEIEFADYNFDNQIDIYINVTASQGWSLSRGHLLIINPSSKKMIRHDEARDFANMYPDSITKTVFSELWNGYNENDQHRLTIFTNKWIEGKLKTVSERDTIY